MLAIGIQQVDTKSLVNTTVQYQQNRLSDLTEIVVYTKRGQC